MENQEENVEPENAEVENEANANEIQMEPVNVDQPDDNQNDLFNEAENPEPAEQWNLEELTWERMLGLDGSFVFFRTCILGCFVEYTFHFIIRIFSTSNGKSFCQKYLYGDKELAFRRCHKYYNRILHVWFNVYGFACGIVFDEYGENEPACKITLYMYQGSHIYAL